MGMTGLQDPIGSPQIADKKFQIVFISCVHVIIHRKRYVGYRFSMEFARLALTTCCVKQKHFWMKMFDRLARA